MSTFYLRNVCAMMCVVLSGTDAVSRVGEFVRMPRAYWPMMVQQLHPVMQPEKVSWIRESRFYYLDYVNIRSGNPHFECHRSCQKKTSKAVNDEIFLFYSSKQHSDVNNILIVVLACFLFHSDQLSLP